MKLKKCEQGHVFDADKFAACPYCAGASELEILGFVPAQEAGEEAGEEAPRSPQPKPFLPVRGWLAAVKGPLSGHDWRLTDGRNFVGGGAEMDADLSADETVEPGRAASVVCDPQSGQYFVHPCETRQLFYCNGEPVLAPRALQAGDRIAVGRTVLEFVPFASRDIPEEE